MFKSTSIGTFNLDPFRSYDQKQACHVRKRCVFVELRNVMYDLYILQTKIRLFKKVSVDFSPFVNIGISPTKFCI